MRRGGFEPEDYAHEVVEVWPECWEAVTLFSRLRTQWRHSFAGPCGLDYLVVFRMLDDMALPAAVRQQLFEDIRVMESQALVVMDRKKE